MQGTRGYRRVVVPFTVAAALAVLPSVAGAGTVSKYHPTRNSRAFLHSAGGWQSSVEYSSSICQPSVTCPAVTNSWRPKQGGRAAGDGYLRTSVSNRAAVSATSRGVWRSPEFRYRGAKGKRPTDLTLVVLRRSDVAGLLDVAGNSANYSVDVISAQSGVALAPIDHRRIQQTRNWTRVKAALDRGALKIGRRYFIRVTTEFKTGAELIPTATVDYDNVLVRASRRTPSHHGGPGHHHGGPGPIAVLRHNRLRIRVGCPKRERPGRCKIRTVALAHKHGPRVTRAGHARVRAGHHKPVKMRVRHRFHDWVKTHDRIVVRERLRIHHHTHRIYRRYRIVRR